jgi:hypothetical protein
MLEEKETVDAILAHSLSLYHPSYHCFSLSVSPPHSNSLYLPFCQGFSLSVCPSLSLLPSDDQIH